MIPARAWITAISSFKGTPFAGDAAIAAPGQHQQHRAHAGARLPLAGGKKSLRVFMTSHVTKPRNGGATNVLTTLRTASCSHVLSATILRRAPSPVRAHAAST